MVMDKYYAVVTEDRAGNVSVTSTKVFDTLGEACTAASAQCASSMTGTIRYAARVELIKAYTREVVCTSVA
jgi:hypothetical protein